ncbi:MAG: DNA polymerase III subunit delta', partial [Acidobacteriota bacterium]
MALSDIIGQERAKRFLKQLVRTGSVPHAILFTGMEGVGKADVALQFAKLLNCSNPREGDCCDECSSCRRMENGNHPDLVWVKSEGVFIKVDQIRALKERVRFRPFEGKWRVMVIQDARTLKEEA